MKNQSQKLTITEAKLKKLARLEISFQEMAGSRKEEWKKLSAKKRYAAAPEDLLAALEHAAALSQKELKENWAGPLWNYGPWLFYLYEEENWSGGVEGYPGLTGEAELTARIWEDWLDTIERGEAWDPESYRRQLEELIRIRSVAVPMRTYPDRVKEEYLMHYVQGDRLRTASETERLLYVLYADELTAKKNLTGMRTKARGCFGGDAAYPCNWTMARDLYLKLMEMDDNPYYPTMLGHIYYGGRIGDGKPDYDKAFYYFSIGAAGGNDEAGLRLSDMFLKGEGVIRNRFIGHKLVWEQYHELLPFLAEGIFDTRFPEAAWRAGDIIRKNALLDEDYTLALHYLLQADFALQERKKIRVSEAELRLEQDLALSLAAVKKKLEGTMKNSAELQPEFFFEQVEKLYGKNSLLALESKDLAKGRKKLTITRISRHSGTEGPILLTLTGSDNKCLLVNKLEIELSSVMAWGNAPEPVLFDGYADGAFVLKGIPVLQCEGQWKIKLPKGKK